MSARHLRVTKSVPFKGYQRVGAIIVTTLAFDTAPQSLMFDSGEGFYDTDGANRSAQQPGINTESGTTSAPRPQDTNSYPQDLIRTATLEENPLTKAIMWVCNDLVPLDDRRNSEEKTSCVGDPIKPEQSTLEQHVPTPKPRALMSSQLFQSMLDGDVLLNFEEAALRPLPITQGCMEKSIELDIPHILHPANHVGNPRRKDVKMVVDLHRANLPEQAAAVMRARFSEGEFEKHLFSTLRWNMFDLSARKSVAQGLLPTSLTHLYSMELKKWCASVFDATVRRVKFAIESAGFCLPWENPITGEMESHPEADPLSDEITKARDQLQDYLRAEPTFTRAVDEFKSQLTKEFRKEWIAYKEKHSLTSNTVKTGSLKQPLRSLTYLHKNTHFVSWYMRRATPACFWFDRCRIVDAIKAIEGESSMLASVLENICVQDLASFKESRKVLEKEKFHMYVKVPQCTQHCVCQR
eukprot:Blabericola_migrator_1__3297@NODE_1971_length_3487_cov_10_071637_g1255_i0_p1_GENE_NODE_1971_length_3487_cov_10_071637_g1255_i0NODE_1971_length_3487_cov_10_071637_g1255_i0_p1_ORF_typecomplete_len467_score59_74MHB/PF16525_5/0_074GrpB/PF04229_14/0_14GrpB/PF04229_14/1_2e04PilM/PF07419_12/1_9PilM/PF07419_12/52ASXH/PF13919_6/0_24_NODE_1971_length_3487_cov_10_071637_g1255_i0401440